MTMRWDKKNFCWIVRGGTRRIFVGLLEVGKKNFCWIVGNFASGKLLVTATSGRMGSSIVEKTFVDRRRVQIQEPFFCLGVVFELVFGPGCTSKRTLGDSL